VSHPQQNSYHWMRCSHYPRPPSPPPPCRTNVFIFLKNYSKQQWWQNTKNIRSFLSMHLVVIVSFFFVGTRITQCTTLSCIDFLHKPPPTWGRQHRCNIIFLSCLGHTSSTSFWFHVFFKGLHIITWCIYKLYCEIFWTIVLSPIH
jgi:hypothetical protein